MGWMSIKLVDDIKLGGKINTFNEKKQLLKYCNRLNGGLALTKWLTVIMLVNVPLLGSQTNCIDTQRRCGSPACQIIINIINARMSSY